VSRTSAGALVTALWLGTIAPGPWWLTLAGIAVLLLAGVPGVRAARAPAEGAGDGTDRPTWRRGRLAAVALAIGLVGAGLSGGRVSLRDNGSLAQRIGPGSAWMEAVVVTEPRVGPFDSWMIVRVERIGDLRVRDRALLRAREPPALGARLELRAGVRELPEGGFGRYVRSLGAGTQLVATRGPHVGEDAALPLRLTTGVRDRLHAVAWRALPPERAGLLTGLVTGDARGRPREVDELLAAAGLRHLVVVSGRHTALFLAGVVGIAALARLGFRATRLTALAALGWFVVLVRWQPSVLRAAAVAVLVLCADLLGRDRDSVHLLAVAVIVLLLVDPLLGRQLGFLLSVAATAGVLVVGPIVAARVRGPRWFRVTVGAATGAQLAVAPVLMAQDEPLPAGAVLANLLAAPAAALAQMIGSMTAIVALVAPGPAMVVAALAGPPLGVLLWTARTAAAVPSVAELVSPLAMAVAVLATVLMAAGRRRAASLVAVASVVLIVLLRVPFGTAGDVPALTVTVLDVGQGEAVLVEAPGEGATARMLVDGGPDPNAVARELIARRVGRLDAVVLTHPHDDHSGGLAAVLSRVHVGAYLAAPQAPRTTVPPSARAALATARGRGVPVLPIGGGDAFRLGSAQVTVLHPPVGGLSPEANDNSVVLLVEGRWGEALLTGDVERAGQRRVLRDPRVGQLEVLKVPHHGGATNSPGFLDVVDPEVAVISAGEGNDYGHPDPAVLAELGNASVLRTDDHGTVTVVLGPNGPQVEVGP
jgi:competence protein ComEC